MPSTPLSTNALSPDVIQMLAERGDVRTLARGGLLVREGDVSESVFILLVGELAVFTRDARGREVIYNTLRPGEILGEMFLDGGHRSASVRATMKSECVEVAASNLRDFMKTYPEFSEVLVVNLIQRLRRATMQIRSLALDDVFDRTVSSIGSLAVDQNGVRVLPKGVTQQQIASRIGATREMVNHVFRRLIKEGVLTPTRGNGFEIRKALPDKGLRDGR